MLFLRTKSHPKSRIVTNIPIYASVLGMLLFFSLFIRERKKNATVQTSITCPTEPQKVEPPKCVNRCLTQRGAYVSGFLETAQYLLATNDSLARVADGEFHLIFNHSLSFQDARANLSLELQSLLTTPIEHLSIGIQDYFSGCPRVRTSSALWWSYGADDNRQYILKNAPLDRQYLAAQITSVYTITLNTSCALLPQIYDTLRSIWRGRDLVILRGDNKQVYTYDVYDTARSQKIYYAPKRNAWDSYEALKEMMLNEDKDKLFIIANGPSAGILVKELHLLGRRALDLGHLAKDYNDYRRGVSTYKFFTD